MDSNLTEEQTRSLTKALTSGRKIEAIKIYRNATGAGVREATEGVEELVEELSAEFPELKSQKGNSGCFSVIVIGFCLVGLGIYGGLNLGIV